MNASVLLAAKHTSASDLPLTRKRRAAFGYGRRTGCFLSRSKEHRYCTHNGLIMCLSKSG